MSKMFCDDCEMKFDESELHYIDEIDKHLCQSCEDCYYRCEECGCLINSDDIYELNGKWYCDECYDNKTFVCDSCGKTCDRDEMIETTDGSYICRDCYEREYNTCYRCDGVIHCNDAIFYSDECYCESCYTDMLRDLGIHAYRFHPAPIFHNEENENSCRSTVPHVGIELEIQGYDRDGFCSDMNKKYGNEDIFYMKEDGSLDDERGVEIVSNPMTYEFIKNENYFKDLFDKMKMYEMDDTDNCGLHFHIDREFCNSKEYLSVIDYIVNVFSDYFAAIGGRDFNEYSDYCKRTPDKERWGEDNYSRYYAVNFENTKTIELRFCASTFNYATFMNRVKMIFGIIFFAYKFKMSDLKQMNETTFIKRFDAICKNKLGSKVIIPVDGEE